MAHYPGLQDPLARFLSTVPDWRVLDKVALENAIKGLPIPVVGPAPPGISLQDAIKVKQHDFLLYDVVYDIVYDVRHLVLPSDLMLCWVDRQCAGEDVGGRILTFIYLNRPVFVQSQSGSCLLLIAMTFCTMKRWTRSQNGCATSTVQHIRSCVGCRRNWLNG